MKKDKSKLPVCTYEIEFSCYEWPKQSQGRTPSEAKYNCFLEMDEIWESFEGFLRCVTSCRRIGRFNPISLAQDNDGFEGIIEARGIPFAYRGMRVEMDGRGGILVGGNSSMNLNVVFDGDTFVSNCHPHWKMKYFNVRGEVIKEYCA